MLYFGHYPNVLARKVFRNAITTAIDDIWSFHLDPKGGDGSTEECHPYPDDVAKMFGGPKPIYNQLKKLLEAFDSKDLYNVSDYNWMLLYYPLQCFTDVYNDTNNDEYFISINGEKIDHIEFGYPDGEESGLFYSYFWDDDFLWDAKTHNDIAAKGIRELIGGSPEDFGIANRMMPHPDELRLHKMGKEDKKNFYVNRECDGQSWKIYTDRAEEYWKLHYFE